MRPHHIVVLTLLALTSCKGGEDATTSGQSTKTSATPTPRGTKPLDLEWAKEDKFQVKGKPKQHGEVTIFQATYQVTLNGFPKGTKWAALDRKGVTDSDVYAILKIVDMREKIGGVPVDPDRQREAKLDPEATLALELPGGETAEIKLPPSGVGLSVDEMLKKVENGPVLFGKEPAGEKPMENVLFLEGLTSEVFGRASLLRDVDAVAKAERLAEVKGTRKCSGYKDNSGKAASDIDLQLKETEVIIFERRTGKIVQKKVFPPDDRCPMFVFRRTGESLQDSSIPAAAIKVWLKTQIQR